MSVPIRVRRTRDLDVIRELDAAIFNGGPAVELHGATWWVAYDDAGPCAFGGVRRIGSRAYLRRAGVLPRARGMGIQLRLIRVRVRYARSLGCSEVVTYTMPGNAASMRSLIRAGFMPTRDYRYVGSDVVYWSVGPEDA